MNRIFHTFFIAILCVFLLYACGKNDATRLGTSSSSKDKIETNDTIISKEFIQTFYPNGTLQSEGWTVNGRKTAFWKYYYPNGNWQAGGHYEHDLKNGWWEEYALGNVKLTEGMYKDGQRNGTYIQYHSNGKVAFEGKYSNDKKTDWWTEYDQQGNKLSEGHYYNGKRNGYFRIYISSDEWRDGMYENDIEVGEWKTYKNGKIIQIRLND